MDNTTQTPGAPMNTAPKKSNTTVTSIIVIIIIILGIWALMKYMPSVRDTSNEMQSASEQNDYATSQSQVSGSDEYADLESDVNTTDIEGVDAGVDSEFGDK